MNPLISLNTSDLSFLVGILSSCVSTTPCSSNTPSAILTILLQQVFVLFQFIYFLHIFSFCFSELCLCSWSQTHKISMGKLINSHHFNFHFFFKMIPTFISLNSPLNSRSHISGCPLDICSMYVFLSLLKSINFIPFPKLCQMAIFQRK